MRPLRLDVVGTIDGSGNATIPLKLPVTGEWHELKLALSTAGPAEWAIVVSGTAITYGRGRRVTLGPELIQDGESVSVNVTGGPAGQQITGALTGKSGAPEEILAGYGPQPNTIALDAAIPRQKLYPVNVPVPLNPATPSFTAPAGLTTGATFTLPAGTTALRILGVKSPAGPPSITFLLSVVGNTTSTNYFPAASSTGSGALTSPAGTVTVPVDIEWDPQVAITVNAAGSANDVLVYVTALFAPEQPGRFTATGTQQTRPAVYDWQVDGAFSGAGTPLITNPAGAIGSIMVVSYLSASLLIIGGGAAATPQLQLLDGATVIKRAWYPVQTIPGQAPPFEVAGLGLRVNAAATWQWDRAIAANQFATLNMAGYFQ